MINCSGLCETLESLINFFCGIISNIKGASFLETTRLNIFYYNNRFYDDGGLMTNTRSMS